MSNWIFRASVIVLCIVQGLLCKSINLTPTEAYVDINKTITLICTYTGYEDVIGTKWRINDTLSPSILRSQDGTCTGTGILSYETIYRVGCLPDNTFTVTILRVQLEDHNVPWKCFDRERSSNTVTVFVKVPVVNVTLSISDASSNLIEEYSRQTLTCRTSTSRPNPNVSWYLQESTNSGKLKVAVNLSTWIISSSEDGRVAVESTLLVYPNRSVNNWMMYCEGWTDNENRSVQSNKLTLNITYPPNNPPDVKGFEVGKTYTLIESETGSLSCTVYGGNPLPKLKWDCYNMTEISELELVAGKTVTRNVTLIAVRGQTSCSCISFHAWSGTLQSTDISIDVQFPTKIATFSLSSRSSGGEVIVINKSDDASFVCIVEANPSSNLTIEIPRRDYISEVSHSNIARFRLHDASHESAGVYTCTGRNIHTKGSPARSQLIVIVRGPPRPSSGDKSVTDIATVLHVDVNLQFSAWKYLDEANRTVFRWFKGNESIKYNSRKYTIRTHELQTNLSIRNTTEHDLGLYRVNVQNSVGEYDHYYELTAEDRIQEPNETVCSTNTGIYIGVSAGSCLSTVIIFALLLIGYKRFRKWKVSRLNKHQKGNRNEQ